MRSMPCDEGAERAVVGSALLEWRRVVPLAVERGLTDEAFWLPACRTVWVAIRELYEEQVGVDALTVATRLARDGQLEGIGGRSWLEACQDGTPTAAHAEFYLQQVKNDWDRRRAIEAASEILDWAYRGEKSGKEVILAGAERFAKVMPGLDGIEPNEVVAERVVERWRKAAESRGKDPDIGLRLPWPELTQATGGLRPGLHVLGGRQSAGKTTFEEMVSWHTAANGGYAVRFSLDATHEELIGRDVARQAQVSLPKMRWGFARKDQLATAGDVVEELRRIGERLRVVTTTEDVDDMCSLAWGLRMRGRLDLLTIDYASVVEAYRELGMKSLTDLRVKLVHVSKRLKRFALQAQVPVLLLSQLNDRGGKDEPDMSSLLESGSLERDAFSVSLLYKDQELSDAWDEIPAPWGNVTKKIRPVYWKLDKLKEGAAPIKIPMVLFPHYFTFMVAPKEGFPSDPVQYLQLKGAEDNMAAMDVQVGDEGLSEFDGMGVQP